MSEEQSQEPGIPNSSTPPESEEGNGEQPADTATGEEGRSRKRKYLDTTSKWVSLAAAASALALSLYNFVGLHARPDVDVTMPISLRLLSLPGRATIIAQPVISITNETQNSETVTGLAIRMRREDPAPPQDQIEFLWLANGHWQSDTTTGKSFWIEDEDEDANAFPVTKDKPWTKIMSFSTDRWSFAPGTYSATLTVYRATTSKPFEAHWCLALTANGVSQINVQHAYYPIRKDWLGASGSRCYQGEPAPAGTPQEGTPSSPAPNSPS
ncbi:hypothetical protein [Streptomyces sp. FH025]|uniref:hypothetical protein n=1 Tax=Streptomyces sp. FH025 TaxID=2815937 RepID=UPI001A9E5786|nr:hypothetical protein [Streptomyces sp. FH025]MBO1419391.1 hypothetical protein [Streptomyces sp. FH025]